MNRYDYIIFDIDDTLFQYKKAERHIMSRIFEEENQSINEDVYEALWALSWKHWDRYHLSNPDTEELQSRYHEYYHKHLYEYMDEMRERYHLNASKETLHDKFLDYFEESAESVENADIVGKGLAERHSLAAASTGLTKAQNSRMATYREYFQYVFVSEELGACKPDRRFWEQVFQKIPVRPDNCLMVGDSIHTDIAGAAAYGIHTCWLNSGKRINDTGIQPDMEITNLNELLEI